MSKKVDLNTFNNDWYKPGSVFRRFFWYPCNLVFIKNRWFSISFIKVLILKLFGAKVGVKVVLKPGINIKYPWKLSIGDHVWIGEDVWIDNLDDVIINDHVCISQGALLLSGNHNYKKSSFDLMVGKIILENGVWIGARSVVCPGVKCASHAVLTVNSVANKDLKSFSIYTGNPAVFQKQRIID